MIRRLCGTLTEKIAPQQLELEINGIGYEVTVPVRIFNQIPDITQNIILYIHQTIREDAHILYGFLEKNERDLFRILIKVNGIGPKHGLNIISELGVSRFLSCIENNDTKQLSSIPGIGEKTAQRLILDTRSPLSRWQNIVIMNPQNQPSSAQNEALLALVALGYKSNQAQKAISNLDGTTTQTVEEIIKRALQNIQ